MAGVFLSFKVVRWVLGDPRPDRFACFLDLSFFVRRAMPMTEAVIPIARDNVDVCVKDYLPRRATVVDTDIDTVCSYRLFYHR